MQNCIAKFKIFLAFFSAFNFKICVLVLHFCFEFSRYKSQRDYQVD